MGVRVLLPRATTGVLVALLTCGASAQVSQFEGRPILDIQFVPQDVLYPVDLAAAVPFKKGEALHAEDIAKAIDGLFSTGRFEDIVVEGEASSNGVIVRFVTKPTWFVGGVTVGGRVIDPPNRGQTASAAQFSLGSPFHDEDVTNAVKSIQQLLESNGLYESRVIPNVERQDQAQQVFISFDVKPGKRARYDTPVIEGETKLSNDTILRATGWRLPIIHWWRQVTESRTRGGVRGLLRKYASQDRLKARVELNKLEYDAQHRRVHPYLSIDPGPKVKVTAVEAKVSKRVMNGTCPCIRKEPSTTTCWLKEKETSATIFRARATTMWM